MEDSIVFRSDTIRNGCILQPFFTLRCARQPAAELQNIVIEVTQTWRYVKGDSSETSHNTIFYTRKDTLHLPLQQQQTTLYSQGLSLKVQHFKLPQVHCTKACVGVYKLRHLMRKEDITSCADLSLQLHKLP